MSESRGRRRGPVPAISRDDIVDAALEHGLAHVTMRDVAERLGVSVQGLYHYVRTREDLLGAAAARLVSRVQLPEPDDGPWGEWLRAAAGAIRETLREHPGVAAQSLLAPPPDGSNVALLQRGVGVLAGHYGVPPDFAVRAIVGLAGSVFAHVAQAESFAEQRSHTPPGTPALDPETMVDFVVDAYVTGLEALLERRRAAG